MKNTNLINSFYRDYKKVHQMLEKIIINDNSRVSRIIDRIIIYIFITNNLMEESLKNELLNKVSTDGYKSILDVYNNSDKLLLTNKINQVTKLFKVEEFEENLKLPLEIINKIFSIFTKYEWNIEGKSKDKTITPDILGNVFEKYINQKEMGAYYTEVETIDYISFNTIIYSILDELNNKIPLLNLISGIDKKYEKINSIEDLILNNINMLEVLETFINTNNDIDNINILKEIVSRITIADIACGTGAFLVETIDLLIRINEKISFKIKELSGNYKFNRIDMLIHIIENNVYGVDIMEDAIVIAKFRLCLKVLIESIKSNQDIKKDIKFNLKVGNTLSGSITSLSKGIESSTLMKISRFNWDDEFPEVINSGGFNCIVGNPPYIEYKKIIKSYEIDNCETLRCGNTYAFMTERAINLLRTNGKIGFIVPISIVSTKRMSKLREVIECECSDIFYSNYGDRPDTLFTGVHQKVTILLAKKKKSNVSNIYSSRYYHWYKEEKSMIFKNIKYIKNPFEKLHTVFKVGEKIDIDIINKINKIDKPISSMFRERGIYFSYLSTRLTFWVKCFNNEKLSNEFKKYSFETNKESLVFTAIMNSSLYYYFWEVVSDEWHITNKELELFKFDYNLLEEDQVTELCELSLQLEKDLENKKVYIGSKQAEYEYRHKNSKIIIDQIDLVLKKYYGLSDDEYKFIVDYNLKYRMNDEYEKYINKINLTI